MSDKLSDKIDACLIMINASSGAHRKKWVNRLYYYRNKERLSLESKKRYEANRDFYIKKSANFYMQNKDSINKKRREAPKSLEFRESEKIRLKKYKEENRDHVNRKSSEWASNNKEKRRAIQKRYRINNRHNILAKRSTDSYKEKQKEWSKSWAMANYSRYSEAKNKWKRDNVEYVLWSNKQRSKKIRQATIGKKEFWSEIGSIYKKCKEMNKECGYIKYNVDHIAPINSAFICGLHVPWNLRIVDKGINASKNNKLDMDLVLS